MDDYLTDQIRAIVGESQRGLNIEKFVVPVQIKRDRGLLAYSPNFYGFRSAGKGKVAPVANELATARGIFDAFLSGKTLAGIAQTLNSRGMATFTGTSQWSSKKIRKTYRGHNMLASSPDSSQQLITAKSFEPHAVVSVEEFQKVQRTMKDG